MGENTTSIDIDVESEVEAVSDRVFYAFVHIVSSVTNELDVGAIGNNVFGRIAAATRSLMIGIVVVFFPFDVIECNHSLLS